MIRSVPAAGYATLWPMRALPAQVPLALAAAGVRPGAFRGAWGYAVIVTHRDGSTAPQRLPQARDRRSARAAAAALLPACACPVCATATQRPSDAVAVDIYRAVALGAGDRAVWERLERLDVVAFPRRRDWWVTKAGERHPLDAAEQEDAAIAALADRLAAIRAEWSEAELRAFWRRLEQEDWATATASQREAAWAAALAAFAQADVRALSAPWRAAITADAGAWAAATRAQIQAALFPTIDAALSQVDAAAVDAVGSQAGLFVRDQLGIESASMTRKGREIVERGLRDGLGREAIAEDLRNELPAMWDKGGEIYSRVVASNAMVRSRSISQASAYRDAGIERYEIMAVMDERTTVVCQGLNGQIISVSAGSKINERAARAKNVDELKESNPFIRDRYIKDENGERIRVLQTEAGVTIASVTSLGWHNVPQLDQYIESVSIDMELTGDQLPNDASIGFPPYHHGCRTTTVPAL
jgi:SPP1 gp7 family putative phage head morphogenesis protein